MPDITMCKGDDCPLKDKCYRFLASPSEYAQSYFVDAPYDKEKQECDHQWLHFNKEKKG
jgi:hypothetical protein